VKSIGPESRDLGGRGDIANEGKGKEEMLDEGSSVGEIDSS